MKCIPLPAILILITFSSFAQEAAPVKDSLPLSQRLDGVTVHAYEQQGSLMQTPAAINYISPSLLRRYSSASIVSAVNALPGVHMEERSPGSYRLSIRGSSLRSPFGVRNVKIYYNDIPFTDPGGNTYLNQLGYYNIASMEIIKGPGSSVYGAGTGGVVLIESMPAEWQEGVSAEVTAGSYGLLNAEGEVRTGKDNFRNVVRYQTLTSDGYREHSALRRDVFSWDAELGSADHTQLRTHFLYGDLHYETPGALTLDEFNADPRAARPSTGFVPGSVATGAAVFQKTFLAGFTVDHHFNALWQNTTTLYGAYSQLYNPTIRNYARSSEPQGGGRSVWRYTRPLGEGKIEWLAGAELQQNFTTVQTFKNKNAAPDTLQTNDVLRNRLVFGFTQLSLQRNGWTLTGGLSLSGLRLTFARLSAPPYTGQVRDFNNEFSPRLALLKSWNAKISTYATVSRGFSPPTSAELSPSGGVLNAGLNAEYGWNYEIGLRGHLLHNRLYYDVSGFYFGLTNTIVQRHDSAAGDFYLNSGSTSQTGAEVYVRYTMLDPDKSAFGEASIWASYTRHHFKYKDFRQLDNDFSGNLLPGVAPHAATAGIDVATHSGLYLNLSVYHSAPMPLNDANTDFTKEYTLLGFRLGYRHTFYRHAVIEVFAGGDNLTDETYSAGPDINGFGGRYYNASPGRSFYAGLSLGYKGK